MSVVGAVAHLMHSVKRPAIPIPVLPVKPMPWRTVREALGGARSAGRLPRVGAEQGGAVVRAEAFRRGMSQGQRAPFSQRLLEQPEPA